MKRIKVQWKTNPERQRDLIKDVEASEKVLFVQDTKTYLNSEK